MSQSKVKDFFTLRKGNRDLQPSKRRKLDLTSDDELASVSKFRASMEDSNEKTISSSRNVSTTMIEPTEVEPKLTASKPIVSKTVSRSQALKAYVSARTRKSKSNKSVPVPGSAAKGQQTLNFRSVAKGKGKGVADSETTEASVESGVLESIDSDQICEKQPCTTVEEVTSVWDDHVNQECTPRKRIMKEEDSLSKGPKARVKKTAARKLNQDETNSPSSPQREVKKKLELDEVSSKAQSEESGSNSTNHNGCSSTKTELLSLVTEMSGVNSVISPLPLTPDHLKTPNPTPTTITPKLHNLSEKLKMLSKMDGQALKNRLKKKGMLGEVKDKVQELSKARSDYKSGIEAAAPPTPDSDEKSESESELPAYQRYDYLAKEGPPTLNLPYTYRLLENAFQAMDTVVSMLHNRAEVCTFDKLQTSVQNITKKNFPQRTASQIKTVLPDAYTFKQEKVPVYGQRTSPYVLTIEANLNNDTDDGIKKNLTKSGKIPFTASVLLRRKMQFKASLLKIVKKQHKTFLESLTPPLRIPDDKLSRWHPKFALDKVPAVTTSDLPQPPNVHVYRSAKDVLEMQAGKLNPRIQQALTKVVAESNSESTINNSSPQPSVNTTKDKTIQSKDVSSSPSQSAMKGIPPALLAKIRAKEALKMEQALTRDPAEERRIRMLGHLPEIIRILRSYFVTEKRPALPLENVIKKLGDSYHTGLSQGEIEQHIKLLKETAPEFVSIVEIKRGKFVKLDKNVDISALSDRINNLVKVSK